jgi:DNA-binding beta-propeller fold protein YncE
MRAPRQLALSPDGRFAYVAASSSGAIDVFARDAVTGALGWQSCVSNNGTDGTCVDGAALRGPWGVAVSPDGGNVYVAARTSGAVVIFARDAATGRLRQTGCVLHLAPVGVCVPTQSLRGVSALAVSADGSTLIAAGTTGVVAFARDPTTGALRQTGCLGDTGCPPLTTVNHPSAVLVAPDGARALVADRGAGTVTLLQNGATGLRELSCLRGRLSYGPGSCAPQDGLDGASAVAASPDGRFVYAGAGRGVLSLPEGAGW